ncbi:hypothetical protein BC829DRAFT_129405 [Chytridium lagenaria]|nr:hypothetical protein BC829DRAFT_129405 [Chytridium lagenaria]
MMKKRSKNGDDASANITYITETLDYNRLVELLQKTPGELLKRGPMEGRGYLLVGLHACGDLSASTMLKTFSELNLVRGLVVVPCCYNLLTEPKSIEDRGENYGFPLSSTVRALCNHHSLIFGHRGRNLACQTFDKFTDPQMRSSVQGHFRRALIDSILTDLGVKPQDLQKDQARRETDTEETERFRIGKLPKEAYGR